MDGKSLTPQEIKLKELKAIFPEAFSENKVDWEKLKATLGEDINFKNERYVLNWAGKSEAFKVLQSPTTKTLVPDKEESVQFDDTQHIFIEGENLEVLKVLQKSYFGKIKMIYIDPPYNTGNDSFIYPDKFSETKAAYEKRVGDKDDEGYLTKDGFFRKNSKENGQYHSNWLNMMYPRMFLAKNLLRKDGVIFVSIDDNEVHNLRLLMNEVFGEENFVGQWNWFKSSTPPNLSQKIKKNVEYVVAYEKQRNKNKYKGHKKSSNSDDPITKPQNTIKELTFPPNSINIKANKAKLIKKGVYGTTKYPNELMNDLVVENKLNKNEVTFKNNFIWLQSKLDKELSNGTIINLSSNGVISYKKAFYEPEVPPNFIPPEIGGTTENAGRNLAKLIGGKYFDYPKPIDLVKYLINFCLSSTDLILDFFTGSGTTAHAVMALNAQDGGSRQHISVQLPELTDEKSEAHKAGYKTIADIAKERIRRAGQKIQTEIDEKIKDKTKEIKNLDSQLALDGKDEKIKTLQAEIAQLQNQDLGFKVLKLTDSNFKQWQQLGNNDAEALEKQMKMFVNPIAESSTAEKMVYELLLKSGKDLNSTIEHTGNYYRVNGTELILMLEKATQEIVDSIVSEQPIKVIALDILFQGNDQLKTNTSLQMKDAGIEFKTI